MYAPDFLGFVKGFELEDIELFIGDGSCLNKSIKRKNNVGHMSMAKQIRLCSEARVKHVMFTHVGHLYTSYGESLLTLRKFAKDNKLYLDTEKVYIAKDADRFVLKADSRIIKGVGSFMKSNKPAWKISAIEEIFDVPGFKLPAQVTLKTDGIRIQMHIAGTVRLFLEDGTLEKRDIFKASVVEFAKKVPEDTILDVRGVVKDNKIVEFQVLDILFYKNKDLRDLPLSERMKYLAKISTTKYLKPLKGGQLIVCKTKKELFKVMKSSTDIMIRTLSSVLLRKSIHNKGWVKFLIEKDWCESKGGVWRTIRGQKICLRPGESPEEAFKYRKFQIHNSKDELVERAKDRFGTTKEVRDGGYIFEDGTTLNLEHKPHMAVEEVFEGEEYGDVTDYFMRQTNAMRVRTVFGRENYNNVMVEIWAEQDLTPKQWASLDREINRADRTYFYFDVMDSKGEAVKWGSEEGARDSSKLREALAEARKLKKKGKVSFKVPLIERWESRGVDFKVKKGLIEKDWCEGQGGHWVTVKGKHVCMGSKVPWKSRRHGIGWVETIHHGPEKTTKFRYTNDVDKSKVDAIRNSLLVTPNEYTDSLKRVQVSERFVTMKEHFHGQIPKTYEAYSESQVGGFYGKYNKEIYLYKGSNIGSFDHEFGHHIFDSLSGAEENAWRYAWENELKVSEYAKVSSSEGLAEAFKFYKRPGGRESMLDIYPKQAYFIDKILKRKD